MRSGLAVEFEVEDGGRGLKASAVRLANGAEAAPFVATPSVSRPVPQDGDEPMCDLLSVEEATRDLTELLLRSAPSLTADQILRVRAELLKFAKSHGWTEG